MPVTKYTKPMGGTPDLVQLTDEINADPTIAPKTVDSSKGLVWTDQLAAWMSDALTAGEETALDAVLAAHTPESLPGDSITVTADYVVQRGVKVIYADATAGNITITLPKLSKWSVDTLYIKKIAPSQKNKRVLIQAPGSEELDGGSDIKLKRRYDSVTLVSDQTKVWIV
tara:strand:+ start:340 stop:849 length:510 start_codon:yes stop_codon:yes gene_type:complete